MNNDKLFKAIGRLLAAAPIGILVHFHLYGWAAAMTIYLILVGFENG